MDLVVTFCIGVAVYLAIGFLVMAIHIRRSKWLAPVDAVAEWLLWVILVPMTLALCLADWLQERWWFSGRPRG